MNKLVNSQNELYELFSFVAQEEINIVSHTSPSAASYCAYTLFRGVSFLVCLVFVCIILYYLSRRIKLFKMGEDHAPAVRYRAHAHALS